MKESREVAGERFFRGAKGDKLPGERSDVPASISEQRAFWIYYALAVVMASAVICGGYLALTLAHPGNQQLEFERGLAEGMHEQGSVDVNVPTLVRVALQRPIYWLILLYAGAPTIAAILVVAWRGGGREVVKLFGRLLPWLEPAARNRALVCYAWIVGLHLALMAALLTVSWILGGSHALDTIDSKLGLAPGAFLVSLLVGTLLREGGTLEELGWRGFGLPTLLRSGMAPLSASILLGVLWAAWHIPRDIATVMPAQDVGSYLWGLSQFMVACVSLSILMAWCFHLTAGSALPAVMIHGLYVHVSNAITFPAAIDLRVPIYLLAALFALGWTRGKLGREVEAPLAAAAPG